MRSLFKWRNLLLLLALGLAVVVVAVAVKRYRPQVAVQVAAPMLPAGIDLSLQAIDYTHSEGGVARWRLVASRAEHQAESKIMLVKDLELTFFDGKGGTLLGLQARNGRITGDYSAVEVSDNVTLTHRDGYTLQTSSLRFNQAEGIIRTEDPVRLTGRGLTMNGVGLRVDLNGRQMQVLDRVHALLTPKPS